MELPLQQNPPIPITEEKAVSILVLMELPLQQKYDGNLGIFSNCFNPCFNGTTSATALEGLVDGLVEMFQSLF